MLDHSPMLSWESIPICRTAQRVDIVLGSETFSLRRLDGYQHRGGLNNADVGRWLSQRYVNTRRLTLLFDVSYDLQGLSVCYKLVGQVDKL